MYYDGISVSIFNLIDKQLSFQRFPDRHYAANSGLCATRAAREVKQISSYGWAWAARLSRTKSRLATKHIHFLGQNGGR